MSFSSISTISSHIKNPFMILEKLYQQQLVTELGSNVEWSSSAISSDGSTMYATTGGTTGYLYKFNKQKSTWEKVVITSPTFLTSGQNWKSIDCDDTGTKLIGCIGSNHVYISNNSGITWTQQNFLGTTSDWQCVSCDLTGNILLACGKINSSNLYLSTNRGVNWDDKGGTNNWSCVSVSKNGQHIIGARYAFVRISHDVGVNWTDIYIGDFNLYSCAIDNNGNSYVGGTSTALRRLNYNSSTGVTTQTLIGNDIIMNPQSSISCSADGKRIIIVNNTIDATARIIVSLNSGTSWNNYQTTITNKFGEIKGWNTCKISSDGLKFCLGQNNGNIVIGTLPPYNINFVQTIGPFITTFTGSAGSYIASTKKTINGTEFYNGLYEIRCNYWSLYGTVLEPLQNIGFMFDGNTSTTGHCVSTNTGITFGYNGNQITYANRAYNTSGTYAQGSTFFTTSNSTNYIGDYIEVVYPMPVIIKKYRFMVILNSTIQSRYPRQVYFFGSNDGSTWILLHSWLITTQQDMGTYYETTFPTTITTGYTYQRMVMNTLQSTANGFWNLAEINMDYDIV